MYAIAYMKHAFMRTSIIPFLKNKNGDISAKSNYRPIAIVTAMSKVCELCLSRIMDVYLFTSDNQFGFKQKHSTDLLYSEVHDTVILRNGLSSGWCRCLTNLYQNKEPVNM